MRATGNNQLKVEMALHLPISGKDDTPDYLLEDRLCAAPPPKDGDAVHPINRLASR